VPIWLGFVWTSPNTLLAWLFIPISFALAAAFAHRRHPMEVAAVLASDEAEEDPR
jgi:hypothetical protein